MTDWVRVAAYTVLGVIAVIGLTLWKWWLVSADKLKKFQASEAERIEREDRIRRSRIRWNGPKEHER